MFGLIMDKKDTQNYSFRLRREFFLIGLFLFFVGAFLYSQVGKAAPAAPPSMVTYQGKILDGTNTPISTALNIQFLLYDAATAGNLLYTGAGTLGTPTAVSLTPSSGIFSIDLGGAGTNPLDPNIFRNNSGMYLQLVIGAEVLTPRKQITASPYAINAGFLNGYALDTASSSVYIPLSDSQGNFLFNNVTSTGFVSVATTTIASSSITNANITNLVVTGNCVGCGAGTGDTSLAGNQTFTGLNVFSATTTFSTTTVAGSTITDATIANATINNLNLTGTLTGLNLGSVGGTGVLAYLANSQTFAGANVFNATTTFTTSTATSSTINTANIVALTVNGSVSLPSNSITDAMVVDSITASNYLPLVGGTLAGNLVLGGNNITGINALTMNGLLTNTGLSALTGGFVASASSSVAAGLQVAGALNASSTLLVNGATVLGSTLDVTGLSAFTTGFISSASSTVGATLHVLGGIKASSTLQVDGQALFSGGFVASNGSTINSSLDVTGALSAGSLALSGAGTFNGPTTFNATSTFATTTIASTTITSATITNLVVNGTCIGCASGAGDTSLAANQTFTGLNNFNATTTFTSTTAASSTIVNANITNLAVNGTVSGISLGSIFGTGVLAYLGNSQAFTGINTFNATSTFATTTAASSTITNANITNLVINGTCTGCASGGASLSASQTFTGANIFSATSSFSAGLGVGTSTPVAKLTVSEGAVLAVGTFGGAGTTPYDGAGTRLMWIPNKAAFRAGYVNGTQWDAANVGVYSAAFGENNQVSGDRAFAAGTGNTVSQTGSVAFGGSNTVSVTYSAAFGASNIINGGGAGFAFGLSNTVSGASSAAAIGTGNTSAGGTGSTAIGANNSAGGTSAIALGARISVSGNNSVGIGLDTNSRTLSQNNTLAIMGGNVGIGSLVPSSLLTVGGTLAVTGTSTFATTTMASSSITQANISNLVVTGTCTGCSAGGGASLSASQTFTGSNIFSATSSFSAGLGVGTSTPVAKFTIKDGAILAIGTLGEAGATPYEGPGVRLMWVPNKAAFRAGSVNNTQWDDTNIGNYSVAFGLNNKASGNTSAVFGTGNTASGGDSFAAGFNNIVSERGIAAGASNSVSGNNGAAFGGSNSVTNQNAFAAGFGSEAGGDTSIALGNGTHALGNNSLAFGTNMTITGGGVSSIGFGLGGSSGFISQANTLGIFGGSVGIGTGAPAYLLDVAGTLGVSATSTFTTTTAASSTIENLNVTSGYIGTLTVGSCTGCGGGAGGASLTADQNFIGANTFSATTTFTNTAAIVINTSTAYALGRLYIDAGGNIFTSGSLQFAGNILPITGVVTSTAIAGNATSTSSTVQSTDDVGAFPVSVVGSDNLMVVAYYDTTNADLVVLHCSTQNCSSHTQVTIDATGDVGKNPSMVIAADGFPVLTYYDATNQKLKIAKCYSVDCSVVNSQILDQTADNGKYSAIAIGQDRMPVVAYQNSTESLLLFKHCTAEDCATFDASSTLAFGAATDSYVKMIIASDGMPLIAFKDNGNAVKMIHCSASRCSSFAFANTIDNNIGNDGGYLALGMTKADGGFQSGSPGGLSIPILAYYDDNDSNVYWGPCQSASCTNITTNSLSAGNHTSSQGGWPSIAIDSRGIPTIAFLKRITDSDTDPFVFSCGNVNCYSSSNAQTAFGTPDPFNYTKGLSLIRSGAGVLTAFYYKSDTGDLMMWQGCSDNDFDNGGCRTTTALSGSSLGNSRQYFYKIYSQEIYAKQAYLSGFDLAESYLTDDATLKPGDVVALDKNNPNRVVKADVKDNPTAIGIVSTKPGLLLTEWSPDDIVFASGTKMVSLALAGRVPLIVSSLNGPIAVGDKLSASAIPGVAVKAMAGQPTIGIAMENFNGTGAGTITTFVNIDSSASASSNLNQGLTIDTSNQKIIVGSSTMPYNFALNGNLSMLSTSLNTISFSTTTLLTSNVGDFENAKAFILNAPNFAPTSTSDRILFSLRAHDTPVFSVAANGDVHTLGNYYGASATFGSSTNPGDLAERVDIAADDFAEAGDVMIVDPNSPDTYRRSGTAYDAAVAGVISTNPTIVVGRGKTDTTAVLAMVGRVPVKVVNENGSINRGDLLVASSKPGFAMKYDPTLDNSQKMVGVIGVALDPFTGTEGKIPALIRTGWAYSQNKNITSLQNNLEQLAVAQGIDLGTGGNDLKVAAPGGQLTYPGGDLNLQGHVLLNVAAITSKDKKWSIDPSGHFITHLTTSVGTQDMYAIQSPTSEFVFSSSSQLVAGEARIVFDQGTQDIIDPLQPLKVTVTLTSAGSKGVYVAEKSAQGFVVKEIDGSTGTATFDWIVVAKRQDYAGLVAPSDQAPLPEAVMPSAPEPTATSTDVATPSDSEASVETVSSTMTQPEPVDMPSDSASTTP